MKDKGTMTLSDEELMRSYQMGNDEAFNILYERYSGKIYNFIQKKLKNRNLTDDAFQSTFLKLHQSRSNYKSEKLFAPWLFTICKTSIVDVLRLLPKLEEYKEVEPQIVTPTVSPSLEGLSEKEKTVVGLRYKDDLSFEEIASKLSTTTENARKILSRAIKKLRVVSKEN